MYKSSPGLEAGATCNKSIRWSEMDLNSGSRGFSVWWLNHLATLLHGTLIIDISS